jgi:hypothetical protein
MSGDKTINTKEEVEHQKRQEESYARYLDEMLRSPTTIRPSYKEWLDEWAARGVRLALDKPISNVLTLHTELLAVDGSSGNPELEKHMAELLVDLFETFKKKQKSYGCDNIAEFGERGVFIRMNDKMKRLKNLVWEGKKDPLQDETVDDTYIDLADYSLISILVRRGLWRESKNVMEAPRVSLSERTKLITGGV